MRRRWMIGIIVAIALGGMASGAGAASFDSGSTGADGAFTASCGTPPCTQTVQLPASGVFNYTTYTIPAQITVKYLRNTSNTPVTILAQGDVNIAATGIIDIGGSRGGDWLQRTVTFSNGGAGGPGGYPGGSGGTNVPDTSNTRGGAGGGPGGAGAGARAVHPSYFELCGGGGGGFGTTGAPGTSNDFCDGAFVGAAGSPYGNAALLPLVAGSGGGGGGGTLGCTTGGGGGGGGAILIASSQTIRLDGSINGNGGAGGNGNGAGSTIACSPGDRPSYIGAGGGGAGGGVRLVATTIAGNGNVTVNGGEPGVAYIFLGGRGARGRIRLEAYNFTATLVFSTSPSLTQPGTVALAGNPALTITTIHTVPVPAAPTGSYATPDVVLPATTPSTVNVVVGASNIPMGTQVNVRVTPEVGAGRTGNGTLPNPPVSVTVPITSFPLDQPFVVDAEATFQLGAWLDSPIKYAGEDVTTVRVAASLGGPSQVTYYTASGKQVPADALAGLGLPK